MSERIIYVSIRQDGCDSQTVASSQIFCKTRKRTSDTRQKGECGSVVQIHRISIDFRPCATIVHLMYSREFELYR